MHFSAKKVSYVSLGVRPYPEVLALQENLRESRINEKVGDTVIFCEHEPVYTVGKQNCDEDWLSSRGEINNDGIEVVYCNRGGRITYHGPGQSVIYFILKILDHSSGVKDFVNKVEETCIDMILGLGLLPSRHSKHPGVWVDNKKVVAIGLNISQGVSMHGLAINVEPKMSHYKHIVPCGIKDLGVASIAELLGKKELPMSEMNERFRRSFEKIFGVRLVEYDLNYTTENVSPLSSSLGSS